MKRVYEFVSKDKRLQIRQGDDNNISFHILKKTDDGFVNVADTSMSYNEFILMTELRYDSDWKPKLQERFSNEGSENVIKMAA